MAAFAQKLGLKKLLPNISMISRSMPEPWSGFQAYSRIQREQIMIVRREIRGIPASDEFQPRSKGPGKA
ncbi:hypothetical protein [Sphingomonas mali]|uniref:hypothetical protein n=1 Tax=Sphingomonas mali TaxID=40682 RepID=UPI000833A98C|nr:hypothetical protein [Sphingomonas mali]